MIFKSFFAENVISRNEWEQSEGEGYIYNITTAKDVEPVFCLLSFKDFTHLLPTQSVVKYQFSLSNSNFYMNFNCERSELRLHVR